VSVWYASTKAVSAIQVASKKLPDPDDGACHGKQPGSPCFPVGLEVWEWPALFVFEGTWFECFGVAKAPVDKIAMRSRAEDTAMTMRCLKGKWNTMGSPFDQSTKHTHLVTFYRYA